MSDEIKRVEDEAEKATPLAELSESALDEVVGGNAVGGPISGLPMLHKLSDITLKRGVTS